MKKLVEDINRLKKEKNVVILVHNYQNPELYKVADFIGDSLGLSREAAKTDADVIVFCGVNFMAESAKILNPEKIVLLPDLKAGCPMADMVSPKQIDQLREKHPKAAVVCYVNTSAAVKAASDICCTSSNVIKVVNSLPNKEVIIVPDKNLASFAARYTTKTIIPWDGYCHVHNDITKEKVLLARKNYPNAAIIAHPECREEVIEVADYTCSTEGMIAYAKSCSAKEIITATEMGMTERLKREVPGKRFYTLGGLCFNMKYNTLEKVKIALEKMQHKIDVPQEILANAKKSLDKMLEVK